MLAPNESESRARGLTLVFTDLVGSTALKSEKGDSRAGELIARHRTLVESNAAVTHGRVVSWAGDGCFLTFEAASAAVIFALHLQQSHSVDPELPKVRIGVHTGEVTEQAQAPGAAPHIDGLAVDLAARIGALALPGQNLLSSVVFDNVRQRLRGEELGVPIEWRAHGAYEFKGVDGGVEICEAGISSISPLTPPEGSEKAHRAVTPGEEDTLGWRPAVGLNVQRRDNWVLEQQLGEGGFGEVWLAVHSKTHAKRVFKFCFEPERVRGLKREVVLFRLLKETLGNRDDIAQILDWDFDHSPYFIEAEYTEGGDLQAWAAAKGGLDQIPLRTRLELVAQTAVALGAAHSVGVLHKDVKPSNILVSEPPDRATPRAALTDFGIGLITDREALMRRGITAAGLTETLVSSSTPSTGGGTRMYMAPELIEGKPATTLSDIYALGVVLYQMVVGDFRHALAPGWERDISDPLLVEDIAACVDGNPDRRLPGAAELATRLRALEFRRAKTRARERAQRRKRQFTTASVIGISLTAVAALFAFRENQRAGGERQARLEAEAARAELQIAKDEADQLRTEAEYGQYLAEMQLIQQAVAIGDLPAARNQLENVEPRLRGWEWGHLVDKSFPVEAKVAAPASTDGEELSAAEKWYGATPKLVATLTGHEANVFDARFTPDGSRVVTRDVDGVPLVWDTATFRRVGEWRLGDAGTGSSNVSLHPAGKLAGLDFGSEVAVIDLATGEQVARMTISRERLWGFLAFSPDGSMFLAQDMAGQLLAWDWRNDKLVWAKKVPRGLSSTGWAAALTVGFASDSSFVVAETPNRWAVCSLASGQTVSTIDAQVPEGFYPVEFAAINGRIAFYNPVENKYLFMAYPSGKPIGEPWSDPSGARFNAISSSADGTLVAVRGDSNTIRLLNAGPQEPFSQSAMPSIDGVSRPHDTQTIAISPKGDFIVVPQLDNSYLVFAPDKGPAHPKGVYAHADSVSAARFMGSDDALATAAFDGTIRVWDLKTGAMRLDVKAHSGAISVLSGSPDGTRWLTTSFDGTIAVWDLTTGTRLYSSPTGPKSDYLGGPRSPLVRIATPSLARAYFSPDGKQLILTGDSGEVLCLDPITFEQRHVLKGHTRWAHRTEFSPDSTLAMTQSYPEPIVRLWDAKTGTLRHVLDGAAQVIGTAFSPDSRRLAAGHTNGRVTVWDTSNGSKLLDWKGHSNAAMTVAFDPSGARLLTASADGTAALWDSRTGNLVARYTGHAGFVTAAWFNPAGDRLLTLGFDHTARVWDLEGHEMLKLDTGDNILNGTWSPTGKRIAITTIEGHIFIYDSIPPAELEAIAPGAALRDQITAWRARPAAR